MAETTTDRTIVSGFDAVTATLAGDNTKAIEAESARMVTASAVAATAIASGMYTRKRAERGQEPILGIVF